MLLVSSLCNGCIRLQLLRPGYRPNLPVSHPNGVRVLEMVLNWSRAYSAHMVIISLIQLDELVMAGNLVLQRLSFFSAPKQKENAISVLICTCIISIICCALLFQLPKTSFIVTTSTVKCRIVQCTGRPSAAVRLTPTINPQSQRFVWIM